MKSTLGYNIFKNVYKKIRSPNTKGHHLQKLHSEKQALGMILTVSLLANTWNSSNQSQLFYRIELLVPCHNKLIKPSQKKSPTLLGLTISKILSQKAVFMYPSWKSPNFENNKSNSTIFFCHSKFIKLVHYAICLCFSI